MKKHAVKGVQTPVVYHRSQLNRSCEQVAMAVQVNMDDIELCRSIDCMDQEALASMASLAGWNTHAVHAGGWFQIGISTYLGPRSACCNKARWELNELRIIDDWSGSEERRLYLDGAAYDSKHCWFGMNTIRLLMDLVKDGCVELVPIDKE
jgi:hypothetical protein